MTFPRPEGAGERDVLIYEYGDGGKFRGMEGTCDMPFGPLQGPDDLPPGFQERGTLMRSEFITATPGQPVGRRQHGRLGLAELVEWGGSEVGEMGSKLW